ncbi:MAG: hypothetical protein KJ749_12660 [Planctomycetes bacterium]|nr:hypothetical protein [Planctomycetota bacterium]
MAICLVLVPGSIGATLIYAWRLHSAGYRERVAEQISRELGMVVAIDRIQPLSLDRRAFENVRVYLEEGGRQVFACREAVWRTTTRWGNEAYALDLTDGWLLVGSGNWTGDEYRRMLSGGLAHDFRSLGLAEVRLKQIDLRFAHPSVEFRAGGTTGIVFFDEAGRGEASLNCFRLNDTDVTQPINIAARFTPGERLTFQEVRLAIPSIEIAALEVDGLVGQPVSCGTFEGTLTLTETPDGHRVDVNGALLGAELHEFTSQLPGGPFHGTVNIELDEAIVVGRELYSLELHGQMSDLLVKEIAPRLAGPHDDSGMSLQINQLRWIDHQLIYLSAQASCDEVSLDVLTSRWGKGMITGTASVNVRSVLIVDDRLRSADVEVVVVPPAKGPGWIDRELIARVAQLWLGIDPTAALPERIEYTRLGMRFMLDDGELRVLGTHGPDRRTILTIKAFGRSWPIVRQPERTFAVPDLLAALRDTAAEVEPEQVISWWQWLQTRDDSPEGVEEITPADEGDALLSFPSP